MLLAPSPSSGGGASGDDVGGASGDDVGGVSGDDVGGVSGGDVGGVSGGDVGGASGGDVGGASGDDVGGAYGDDVGDTSGASSDDVESEGVRMECEPAESMTVAAVFRGMLTCDVVSVVTSSTSPPPLSPMMEGVIVCSARGR